VFNHEWVATLWRRFCFWLYSKDQHSPKLLSLVRTHQRFFEQIDGAFATPLDMTDVSLLHLFGVSRLRAHLLPTRFLADQLGVNVTDEAKLDAAEHARIADLLAGMKHEPWSGVMRSYYASLGRSNLSARSVRMYLSTAQSFARSIDLADMPWTMKQLELFVKANPGSRNNLSRFISFCRQSRHWDVAMPSKAMPITPLKDPLSTVSKLAALLAATEAAGVANASTTTLVTILARSLGVAKTAILAAVPQSFTETSAGISIQLGRENVVLPEILQPYARALMSKLGRARA
jgi:hypothetical protein